jgi:hypothetical protein
MHWISGSEDLRMSLSKCKGCGGMLCFMCKAHVDAPDQGLTTVCEDCAAKVCEANDLDEVPPGGVIHLESYSVMEDLEDLDEFDEDTMPDWKPNRPN